MARRRVVLVRRGLAKLRLAADRLAAEHPPRPASPVVSPQAAAVEPAAPAGAAPAEPAAVAGVAVQPAAVAGVAVQPAAVGGVAVQPAAPTAVKPATETARSRWLPPDLEDLEARRATERGDDAAAGDPNRWLPGGGEGREGA